MDNAAEHIKDLEKRVQYLEEAMAKVAEILTSSNEEAVNNEAWVQRARQRSIMRRMKQA